VVSINDANNRVVPVDTQVSIYLRGWHQGFASYGGTVSVRAMQGIATFDDLHVDGAGSGYTLSALSDIGADSVTSDTFSVRFTPAITYSHRDLYYVNGEVFGTTADGSTKVNLTNDSSFDYALGWSPDGSRLLVVSDRTGNQDIYTLDSNSVVLTNLTQHTGNDVSGVWCPDGQRILFLSDRDRDGGWEIYVMKADGSGQTRLTNDSALVYSPVVSPDGTRLIFSSNHGGTWRAYRMNVDGTGRVPLTSGSGPSFALDWSPLGDLIALSDSGHLILEPPDGGTPKEIVGDSVTDSARAWGGEFSPDGKRIAFFWGNHPPHPFTLEIADVDGSGVGRRVGFYLINPGGLEWSPDGNQILFDDGLESWRQVFRIYADGSGSVPLPSLGPHDDGAHFRP
jgi:Tol biopolymer transport system component